MVDLCDGGCFLSWADFAAWDADIASAVLAKLVEGAGGLFDEAYIRAAAIVALVLDSPSLKMVEVWPSDITCDGPPQLSAGRMSDGSISVRT